MTLAGWHLALALLLAFALGMVAMRCLMYLFVRFGLLTNAIAEVLGRLSYDDLEEILSKVEREIARRRSPE